MKKGINFWLYLSEKWYEGTKVLVRWYQFRYCGIRHHFEGDMVSV